MKRLVALVLVIGAFGATNLQGCGDDASDDDTGNDAGPAAKGGKGGKGGSAGKGGKGGSGGGGGSATSSASGAPAVGGDVKCGSMTCAAPPGAGMFGGFATACCADEATSTCGMSVMGSGCSMPVADDPRCPGLDVMGFIKLPSCCTAGQCGIDASMFGMPGCVDLKSAAERAGMMGGSGTMIPEPRACDAAGGASDAGI